MSRRSLIAVGLIASLSPLVANADLVRFKQRGKELQVEGNVLAEDSFGAILLEGQDTRVYYIVKQEIISRTKSPDPVIHFTGDRLRSRLKLEYERDFKFISTKNYVIGYTCSTDYAREAGKLLERAYSVFHNYFRSRGGFDFERQPQPMVCIIYGTREEFVRDAGATLGARIENVVGLYDRLSNRMLMYDAFGNNGDRLRAAARYNPNAEEFSALLQAQNVSVVIHEAVHQIAFNVGMHSRIVENPVWVIEGMAMFFETPDLDARGGWRGVGELNPERLRHLAKSFDPKKARDIKSVLIEDAPFQNPRTALDSYAEAWALTYFLAKTRTKEYFAYLKALSAHTPFERSSAEVRIADFKKAFKKSPEELEVEYRRYVARTLIPKARGK